MPTPEISDCEKWFDAIPASEMRTLAELTSHFGCSESAALKGLKSFFAATPLARLKLDAENPKYSYEVLFESWFASVPQGDCGDFEDLRMRFRVSEDTVRKHLNDYLSRNSDSLLKLRGFLPSAKVLLELVSTELGTAVDGANLEQANSACKRLVDRLVRPLHEELLKSALEPLIAAGHSPEVLLNKIVAFVFDDYQDFAAQSANSTVSIGGSLNESLLAMALASEGLTEGTDFFRTGRSSSADIKIEGHPGKKPLWVEVKSYHARERLLRGLRDISEDEKVGVGFFKDPSEFNERAVDALVNKGGAWAVYLPGETLAKVVQESRDKHSPKAGLLLRPLSQFPAEMRVYRQTGTFPK